MTKGTDGLGPIPFVAMECNERDSSFCNYWYSIDCRNCDEFYGLMTNNFVAFQCCAYLLVLFA